MEEGCEVFGKDCFHLRVCVVLFEERDEGCQGSPGFFAAVYLLNQLGFGEGVLFVEGFRQVGVEYVFEHVAEKSFAEGCSAAFVA